MKNIDQKKRVIIEHVSPQVNCGKFPVKRTVGEEIVVTANIYADGHDEIKARLLHRKSGKRKWEEVPMIFVENDLWRGKFIPQEPGTYEYTIQGQIDHFATWQKDLRKKAEAGQDIYTDLLVGANLVEHTAEQRGKSGKKQLDRWINILRSSEPDTETVSEVLGKKILESVEAHETWKTASTYDKTLTLEVDRKKALFSTWYELFPRSAAKDEDRHGTFKDVERLLPHIAEMGFDVLYFPPIHPIGRTHRKGKNNAITAQPGEPGSPWAIGAKEGGHKSIHPELGTLEDFTTLIKKAKEFDIEIAMDIAYQCSPDHPYVKKYPEWFRWRPDGTVQYAENPPKKYEDIIPFDFETSDWENLWNELKSIVEYWIDKGITIFRVDNPHTKPFEFWNWMIKDIRKQNPNVLFLAEAFTRPRIMERLAKLGFNQSYTYYTWRTDKEELEQYMSELTTSELREYFRPNFWPNTPDILTPQFWDGHESVFITRLVMAATLSSNYGLYGPVYEKKHYIPRSGKEEYIDSEKYEIHHWDWQESTKIKDVMIRINKIRKENPALQFTWYHYKVKTDNKNLFAFAKTDQHGENPMLIVVNLHPTQPHSGWIEVPLQQLGIDGKQMYVMHDLISGSRYNWQEEWNYVELHPEHMPVHVFRIEQFSRIEKQSGLTGNGQPISE